jgi:hypothetical protein
MAGIGGHEGGARYSAGGGLIGGYVAKAVSYVVTLTDYTIDVTAADVVITLPTAVGIAGRIFNIANSSGVATTVDANGIQTIYTTGGAVESVELTDGQFITVQSTGANWRAI